MGHVLAWYRDHLAALRVSADARLSVIQAKHTEATDLNSITVSQ